MSTAFIGHGSKLRIKGPTGGTALTTPLDVACTSLSTGSNKVDVSDVTDMLTAGTARVFIAGLENSGDISVKFNMKPADPAQVAYIATKGIATDFAIIAPGGAWSIDFSAINTGVDYDFPDDKPIACTSKAQISGPITVASGT